jgi:hypothetical protein
MTIGWEELGALALARQFPDEPLVVAEAVRRIGPIQSQTARSPFLALAARFPGVTHQQVTAAYDDHAIVRGSTIRGTVHTTVPEQHALLEVATRIGQRALWVRMLRLDPEPLWGSVEGFARHDWRTTDELLDHVRAWTRDHGGHLAGLETTAGRYLGFGHGGLVRKPLKGGWEGQGAAAYRTAAALLGPRDHVLSSPTALDELVSVHLRAHGPASRHDLAWWSGLGLTRVDEVLARLDLEEQTGPDGRAYVDLPDAPAPREVPGVRLLPEFDALMCAYAPPARARFMDPDVSARLWGVANGLVLPPLLVDGRIAGYWRATGSARKRPLEVVWFAGHRRPRKSELEAPVAALEAALDVTVTEVTVQREAL